MINHVIKSKEDLLNHISSSQKLQILDQKQIEDLLALNIPPEVWKDASNKNLLSFCQKFVQETEEFTFNGRKLEYFHLISYLTKLTVLKLSNNKICDISNISQLKNLRKLYLARNTIKDIQELQSLPDLTHLNLYQINLTSYTLVLPNLVELALGNNKLQDKSGLQHSPKLQNLYLFKTETADLSTICQPFGLKDLDLSYNNFQDIRYLSNFVDLQILNLGYNKLLQNIGPLQFCAQLTELSIPETNVADIWPLQFMKNLKALNMFDTQVIDLHPLQHLCKLERLSSDYACIIDVSPLSRLTQLKTVSLNNNKINIDALKILLKNILLFTQECSFSEQQVPTTEDLKFYNKILSVHTSYKQIKTAEGRISKFRERTIYQKQYLILKINGQIQIMNHKIQIIFSLRTENYQ
ncbi:Conserved_hypothetical protein [Hexamita inflata]|uniref:Uncharacterized protein n=1 Tax=Hexamita inflata TaxID=28002 RepID=A0AA86UXT6_9EUKA|nr:Conserved hypothetical protein [Hexamita inflata]